jgi:hypothetical protein
MTMQACEYVHEQRERVAIPHYLTSMWMQPSKQRKILVLKSVVLAWCRL